MGAHIITEDETLRLVREIHEAVTRRVNDRRLAALEALAVACLDAWSIGEPLPKAVSAATLAVDEQISSTLEAQS